MSHFAKSIFKIFSDLIENHRFVPAYATSSKAFASLVRWEAEDTFVYVFVKDGRSGNANMEVSVWIAPPEEPGDGLDNLYVGYKIRIGSEYDVDEEFFRGCQARIVQLLSFVPALVPCVRAELASPAIRTRMWTSYQMIGIALTSLLTAASDGNSTVQEALGIARKSVAGSATRKQLEVACIEAATTLYQEGRFDHALVELFRKDPKLIGYGLVGRLYGHVLGEASRRRLGFQIEGPEKGHP